MRQRYGTFHWYVMREIGPLTASRVMITGQIQHPGQETRRPSCRVLEDMDGLGQTGDMKTCRGMAIDRRALN